jgi:cob(I)alamin adenosyltransferase
MHGKLQRVQDRLDEARGALGAHSQYKGHAAIAEPLQAIQCALDAAKAYCADPGAGGIDRPTVDTYLEPALRAVKQLWQEVSTTMTPVVPISGMTRNDARSAVRQLYRELIGTEPEG